MRRPTDFMITCPLLVSTLTVGYRESAARALRSGAPTVAGLLAIPVIAAVVCQSVPLGIAVWLGCLAVSLVSLRRSSGVESGVVVECYREWAGAGGRYSPPSPTTSAHLPWARRVCCLAAVPPLSGLGWMLARSRLTGHTARVCTNSGLTTDSLAARCELALHLYLCYPDLTFNAPSGHGGVWFPNQTLDQRRGGIARLIRPVTTYAVSGIVSAVALSLVAIQLPWWLAVVAIALLVGGGLSSLAILLLAPRLLRAELMEPLARLAAQETLLLPPAANEWEECVQRIANSTYECDGVRLCEHLFMGWLQPAHTEAWHPLRPADPRDIPSPMPLLVHRSVFEANCHITGATQSGKSIMALLGLALQLIRGHQTPSLDRDGKQLLGLDGQPVFGTSDPVPLLVIDLKGDLALKNSLEDECRRLGRTFRAFTLEKGCATPHFNMIRDLAVTDRPVIESAELYMETLSLFHGMSYGRSYYSKQSRDLLTRTLKNAKTPPTSWEALHQMLHDELDHAQHKDVFELLSSMFALAQYPVLGPPPPGVEAIHMPSVIANGEVVLFALPARSTSMSCRDVAKMALYCFMTAAAEWNRTRGPRKSVCMIDEAQIITSRNLSVVFQQCSGANMTMVLSNQAPVDLNTEDAPHLADTVRVNTRFKQAFTILEPDEAKVWMESSGETESFLRGWSNSRTVTQSANGGSSSTTHGVSHQPVVHKRLNQNVINQVNNNQGESLVHVATSAGFTQLAGIPRRVWSPWLMTKAEYIARRTRPWPTTPQPTTPSADAPKSVVNTHSPEQVQDAAKAKYAQLDALFARVSRGRRDQSLMADEVL